jgi:hypothetical protein
LRGEVWRGVLYLSRSQYNNFAIQPKIYVTATLISGFTEYVEKLNGRLAMISFVWLIALDVITGNDLIRIVDLSVKDYSENKRFQRKTMRADFDNFKKDLLGPVVFRDSFVGQKINATQAWSLFLTGGRDDKRFGEGVVLGKLLTILLIAVAVFGIFHVI